MLQFTLIAGFLVAEQAFDFPWVSHFEHLTLTTALLMTVVTLWRTNVKKEALLQANLKVVVEALERTSSSSSELRRAIEGVEGSRKEIIESLERVAVSVGSLPCNLRRG